MTAFADELRGSEGEWCLWFHDMKGELAIIRAVHDKGEKVTIQTEDMKTHLVRYPFIRLLDEDEIPR